MVTGADVPVMLVLMGMILCAGLLGLTFYYGFKYRSADSLQKAAESMADPVRARQIAIAQARDQAIKHQMQAR